MNNIHKNIQAYLNKINNPGLETNIKKPKRFEFHRMGVEVDCIPEADKRHESS